MMGMRISRSIGSRIRCRIAIPDRTPGDTAEYLQYRCKASGNERQFLSSDAITVLHEGTNGLLRDIDRAATARLKIAARKKLTTVDRALVTEALECGQQRQAAHKPGCDPR
jgi:type II secretory pathway predicted ATPase ExeA